MPQIGALLVGHNTWGGDDPNRGSEKEGAFGGAWSGPQFVLAHQPPVMLGDGVRMFEHPGGAEVALERISAVAEPGATNLWFRVI